MKRTLYCGGPALGLLRWLGAVHCSNDLGDSWAQLRDRQVIGTHRGRSAIALACRLLGIGPGHEVLVPAYNCGTELDALLYSGARTVAYRISRQCEIDLEDLVARRTSRTRAVYLIHYFGWEQPMEKLRQWCDAEKLLLIEDCALALFSGGSHGGIGRTGDAAIFSLPKTLGCGHGGLLSLSMSRRVEIPRLAPAGFPTLFREIAHSGRAKTFRILEWLGLYGGLLSARRLLRWGRSQLDAPRGLSPMPDDYYFDQDRHADRALHPQARVVAGACSCEKIVSQRRSNYLRLSGRACRSSGSETALSPTSTKGSAHYRFHYWFPTAMPALKFLCAKGIEAFPGGQATTEAPSIGRVFLMPVG